MRFAQCRPEAQKGKGCPTPTPRFFSTANRIPAGRIRAGWSSRTCGPPPGRKREAASWYRRREPRREPSVRPRSFSRARRDRTCFLPVAGHKAPCSRWALFSRSCPTTQVVGRTATNYARSPVAGHMVRPEIPSGATGSQTSGPPRDGPDDPSPSRRDP